MARFLKLFGSVLCLTLGFFVQSAYAGGPFFGAEDRARMCLATANTVTESTRCIATRETASGVRECTQWAEAPCASPITTKDGQKFCPQQKPTSVCATALEEVEP